MSKHVLILFMDLDNKCEFLGLSVKKMMKLSIFDKQIIHIKKSNDMQRKRIRVFNGVSPGKIDAGFRFIGQDSTMATL